MTEPPYDPELDDLPPHDLVAEQAVIGSILLNPAALDEVVATLKPADFYRPAHELVLAAAVHVAETGATPDHQLVAAELGRRGQLLRIGGLPYLIDCVQQVPTTANVRYYAERVAAVAQVRRIRDAGLRLLQLSRQGVTDLDGADELAARAVGAVEAATATDRRTGPIDLVELAAQRMDEYEASAPPGVATPWRDLDAIIAGGPRPGTLVTVGARPSVGKSVVVGQIAVTAARAGVPTLWASLEMTQAECMDRVYAQVGSARLDRLVRHDLDEDTERRVMDAFARLSTVPLRIDDDPRHTLATLAAAAQDMARGPGLGLLVVDYMQLISPADSRVPRREQVDAIARGLKLLAKKLAVPVVAAAQLNRDAAGRRPTLADLREAGGIEQDSDIVVLLHVDDDPARFGELDLIVAKNRQGPTGSVTVAWQPHYARAADLARREAG